ncbi:MAG: hypothetical protein JWN29_2907 [Acidimicrobiales bacterium]|nr:hypothetical protein [Acidimicrobiales bacterium]
MAEDPIAVNKLWWNESAIDHHERTYDLAPLREGGDVLYTIEAGELGDLTGLRVCHLQCHIGQDTLSLLRRGAAQVVGLDFSGEAVERATRLAVELGLDDRATFVESTVQDARRALDGEFDLVFVSWGALLWLPDMEEWAGVVASLLRPGGSLYLAESHPFAVAFERAEGRFVERYPYGGGAAVRLDEQGDYKDPEAVRRHTVTIEYSHGLDDIIGAVIGAGLRLDFLHEHQALPWKAYEDLVLGDDRLYRLPGSTLPLSFSLGATKP